MIPKTLNELEPKVISFHKALLSFSQCNKRNLLKVLFLFSQNITNFLLCKFYFAYKHQYVFFCFKSEIKKEYNHKHEDVYLQRAKVQIGFKTQNCKEKNLDLL